MGLPTVAFVGDSLTEGFGSSGDASGGFRRWVRDQWVTDGLGRSVQPIGEIRDPDFALSDHSGVGGDEATDAETRVVANFGVLPSVLRVPRLWVLLIGTNNAVSGAATTSFTSGEYESLITAMRDIANVPFIVSTIPDSSDVNVSARAATINAWLQGASGWDALETSLGVTFDRRDWRTLVGAWNASFYADAFHWNSDGYALVGADLDPRIRLHLGLPA